MRILANVDILAPLGGVEVSTMQVCRSLASRGHDIDLLYVQDGGFRKDWASFSHRIQQVPGFTVQFAKPWRKMHVLPGSVRAGVRCKPDVVYLNRSEQLLWGALTSSFARAPLVCHLRHHPFSPGAVRMVGRSADRYIAVSDFIRNEWIVAGIPADRIEVVHNGVDPDSYPIATDSLRHQLRADLGIDPDSRVVLHYGRLTTEKGVGALLQAWERARVPEHWILLLAGAADPDVEQLVRAQPVGRVHLLGRRDDVTGLLGAADVVILPAIWHEPFGRIVIESMAAGVPVIASNRGGIPEILSGSWSRFLIDPDDVDSVAAAITEFGDWRASEPGLGQLCRAYVSESFNLEITVDGVEDVLRSVVSPTDRRSIAFAAKDGR